MRQDTCGAKTRKGTPCAWIVPKRGERCKFHGGRSTGPKTPEGKARSFAASLGEYNERRRISKLAALATDEDGLA